jgi:hypothetical protein
MLHRVNSVLMASFILSDTCREISILITAGSGSVPLGSVEADIDDVRVALIDGLVKGRITASERTCTGSHARVMGQVNTPSLAINCGAVLEGTRLAARAETRQGCGEKVKMRAMAA